jgi:Holliday junction resolvasome RuvABC endonuclease subunit
MKIIGIDPGLQGGIALLEDGLIIKLIKMPLAKIETRTKKKVGKMTEAEKKLHKAKKPVYKTKNIINSAEIAKLIKSFNPDMISIEQQMYLSQAHDRSQGSTSTGTTGENVGRIFAVCESWQQFWSIELKAKTPSLKRTYPHVWKRYFDIGADKKKAIAKAEELFPHVDLVPPRCREKSDGMAEALLLAVYGSRPSKEGF